MTIASWSDVERVIRANHHVANAGDGWLGLQWDSGQRQHLMSVSVRDRAAVIIRCPVALESSLDPRTAMAYSSRLSMGALALESGHIVLQATLLLEGLTPDSLAIVLESLALEATSLRAKLYRPMSPRAALTFHAYAD